MFRQKTLLLFGLTLFLLSSCAAKYTTHGKSTIPSAQADQLRQAAEQWIGTPYRYGGNSHQGIDCSGLACQLYQQVFDYKLPRQANAQRNLGYSVHYPYLKSGDLIFFRFAGDERIEHVGLYLGDKQFIHASTTRGVVIDRLDDPYYQKHIVVIKRILR